MAIAWILVANNTQARIFSAETSVSPIHEIAGFVHNENRLHVREMTSDLPGKIKSSGGAGGYAFEQPSDPKKHEARNFAHQLAQELEEAFIGHKFEKLLLIAEPSFLGLLREQLSEAIKKQICFELDKNITLQGAEDIRSHLPSHLPLWD